MNNRGLLFVISGPAGSGKGTIVSRVRELAPFEFSVSATTRAPRPGEIDGVHYHYMTKEAFREKIAAGEMFEYAEYVGNLYGTPKHAVEAALNAGKNIILEIDAQGAMQVKSKMPEAILIFVMPPDYETLVNRIRGRGTETAGRSTAEGRLPFPPAFRPYDPCSADPFPGGSCHRVQPGAGRSGLRADCGAVRQIGSMGKKTVFTGESKAGEAADKGGGTWIRN